MPKKIRKSEIDVPMDELLYITPDARVKFFKNMIANFPKFIPEVELMYCTLNFNSAHKADYVIIGRSVINDVSIITWDIPYLYTPRTLPGYRYAVKTKQYKEYFNEVRLCMCKMSEDKFWGFLREVGLDKDKDSPNFWMDKNNRDTLIENLEQLSLRSNTRK